MGLWHLTNDTLAFSIQVLRRSNIQGSNAEDARKPMISMRTLKRETRGA